MTLSYIAAHRIGKLSEYLNGDESVVNLIADRLTLIVALFNIEETAREQDTGFPLSINPPADPESIAATINAVLGGTKRK